MRAEPRLRVIQIKLGFMEKYNQLKFVTATNQGYTIIHKSIKMYISVCEIQINIRNNSCVGKLHEFKLWDDYWIQNYILVENY